MGRKDDDARQGGCYGGYQDGTCCNVFDCRYGRMTCRLNMVTQPFYGRIEGLGDPYETYCDDKGCPLCGRESETYTCHTHEYRCYKVYVRVVLVPQESDAASGIDETVPSFAPSERMRFVSVGHGRNGYKGLPTATGAASAGHASAKTTAYAATAESATAVVVRGHDNHGDNVGDNFAHFAI